MRLKKGFTLAEILIVLMVIGVIATMTIPSMMKGVTEAQLKAGYKKAYNTISNFAAMERTAGSLPAQNSDDGVISLYIALNNALSVKGFGVQKPNAAVVLDSSNQNNYPSQLKYTYQGTAGQTMGTSGLGEAEIKIGKDQGGLPTSDALAWIITEDNIAYSVAKSQLAVNTNCATKQEIAAQKGDKEATQKSCAIIYVDVNGLSKGPNTFNDQGYKTQLTDAYDKKTLDTITGDQYKIYLGIDGATAGPRLRTITGRIMADLK